jgi:hypothetical protein
MNMVFLKQTAVTERLHFTFLENFNHLTSPVRRSENFNDIKKHDAVSRVRKRFTPEFFERYQSCVIVTGFGRRSFHP